MKRALNVAGKIALGLFLFLAIYTAATFYLSLATVNRKNVATSGVPMYLLSNGAHLDLVVPARHPMQDWTRIFPYQNTVGKDSSLPWIGIGWGDKGFYLNTPTWADLKFSTAFKAATGISTTAVHATYMQAPIPGERARFLYASEAQYRKIIERTMQSLELDANGRPKWIPTNANYGPDDAFYEATGTYSAFTTSNTWSNATLKYAGMKACLWTPLAQPVLDKYPLEGPAGK